MADREESRRQAALKREGAAGVRDMGHRAYVGGRWDRIGRLQLDYMDAAGLQPHHRLLDVGCGALRGGVHFIRYLEPGHYYGIDRHHTLLDAGRDECDALGLLGRRPNLHMTRTFRASSFGVRFDHALAFSVFTHLAPDDIRSCLDRVRSVMARGGVFHATFFEGPSADNPDRSHDHALFRYTPGELASLADGWTFEYVGAFGHPRGQVMARFHA